MVLEARKRVGGRTATLKVGLVVYISGLLSVVIYHEKFMCKFLQDNLALVPAFIYSHEICSTRVIKFFNIAVRTIRSVLL